MIILHFLNYHRRLDIKGAGAQANPVYYLGGGERLICIFDFRRKQISFDKNQIGTRVHLKKITGFQPENSVFLRNGGADFGFYN